MAAVTNRSGGVRIFPISVFRGVTSPDLCHSCGETDDVEATCWPNIRERCACEMGLLSHDVKWAYSLMIL